MSRVAARYLLTLGHRLVASCYDKDLHDQIFIYLLSVLILES